MQRIITAAAALCIIALTATGTQASSLGRPCTSAPESQYLPAGQLQAKAEEQGYKVRRVKIAKACAEVYGTDKNGARVELFLDPTNGNVVGTRTGDDD